MPTVPLSDETLAETVAAFNAAGSKQKAAAALNINRQTLDSRLRRAAERGLLSNTNVLPGYLIQRMMQTFDAAGQLQRTSVIQKPEPGPVFSPPPDHAIKGVSALIDAEGRVVQQWVKTRQGAIGQGLTEALRDVFKDFEGAAPIALPHADGDADLLTVIPVADLHIGMMSWGAETGEAFDLAIARRAVQSAYSELIGTGPSSGNAVVAFIGDILHQNDATNRTPNSGHHLDVDGRYPKVLRVAAEIVLHILGLALQRFTSVKVIFTPGNHDPEATAALHLAVSMFYQGHSRIEIEPVPASIIYHRWGKTLFGFTHGDKLPPDRMAHAMAADRPKDWGETTCRRFYSGHYHRESTRTAGAVKCESVGTPIAKDAYAFAGGWRSERLVRAFHFHAERGETGTTAVFVR